MRRKAFHPILGCLAALLALTGGYHAAVAIGGLGASYYDMIVGIIEGPDPVPMMLWHPEQEFDPDPNGDPSEDGRPDIAFLSETGWPVVAWADTNGTDRDIAFSEWDGSGWTYPVHLSSGMRDDIDPRIFAEADGTLHVVWWVDGPSPTQFHMTRLGASSVWRIEEELEIPGPAGRRPSVAVLGGALHVAYERDRGGHREVVVARQRSGGRYAREVVGTTPTTGQLDVWMHVEAGVVWMDWKETVDTMAYSKLVADRWSDPATVVRPDPSWYGEMEARDEVRSLVLSP